MKYFATAAAFATIIPGLSALVINTPNNVVQCQPTLLTYGQGTPPYFVSILPGGQPAAPATKTFPETSATSVTWLVDIGAGTPLTLQVKDNTGAIQFSDIFTILSSSDASCVNSTVAISGAPGPTSAGGSSSTTSGAASATGGSTTTGGSSKPASSSTGSPAPSQTGNAGFRTDVGAIGAAAVMGLLGLTLLG